MQNVELYISGQRVHLSEGERIALTKQVNSLGEVKNRNADFSNIFTVPATNETRVLFGFSDKLNSTSRKPYQKQPARVVMDGVDVVPNGYAIIEGAAEEESFEVSVYSGIVSFFSRIENKTIQDIDWSYLNQNFAVDDMPQSMYRVYHGNQRTWLFPLVQYGELSPVGQNIDVRYQSPAIFLTEMLRMIITEAGYTYSGDIFSDEFFQNVVIPGTLPFGKPDKFAEDRGSIIGTTTFVVQMTLDDGETKRIKLPLARYSKFQNFSGTLTAGSKTVTGLSTNQVYFLDPQMKVTAPGLQKNTVIDSLQNPALPFPEVYLSEPALQSGVQVLQFETGPFTTGEAGCWDPVTQVYTADDYYAVDVKAKVWFGIPGGQSADSVLYVYKNGAALPSQSAHHTTGGQIFDYADYGYRKAWPAITLAPGDTLEFYLEIRNTPGQGNRQVYIYPEDKVSLQHTPTNDLTRVDITVRKELIPGSSYNPVDFLPELNQKDVVKDFLQRFCVLVDEDTVGHHLRFKTFKSVALSTSEAQNISDKFVLNKKPKQSFRFKDYGQRNLFLNSEDSLNEESPELGDHYFNIDDEALQVEKEAVKSIYAASESETALETLTMARIQIWENQEVEHESKPRILALKPENKTVTFYTPIITGSDGTVTWDSILGGNNLLVGYFVDESQVQDLGWESLIENYYQEWIRCLTNCKILQAVFDINSVDYNAFDLLLPVWIEYFNEYFYINKISQFQGSGNAGTTFELVRL